MLPFYSCFMVQRYILYLNNKTNLLKYLEVIEILRLLSDVWLAWYTVGRRAGTAWHGHYWRGGYTVDSFAD